eukprot:COSAG03_NODE_13412_length_504_cov_0.765432_1_plen_89_part_10
MHRTQDVAGICSVQSLLLVLALLELLVLRQPHACHRRSRQAMRRHADTHMVREQRLRGKIGEQPAVGSAILTAALLTNPQLLCGSGRFF